MRTPLHDQLLQSGPQEARQTLETYPNCMFKDIVFDAPYTGVRSVWDNEINRSQSDASSSAQAKLSLHSAARS